MAAATPEYTYLRLYNNSPDDLAAAMAADPNLRTQVETELSLLVMPDNTQGHGSIVERCTSSARYADGLRKALG